MSPKARLRRKDLRRPDEFHTLTARALRYASAHARLLGWIGAGVVTVFIVGVAMINFRRVQAQTASTELARAVNLYNAGEYGQAARLLQDFTERWAGSSQRPIAHLYLGETGLADGNHEQATAALREALEDLIQPFLRQQALVTLGYALEATNDRDAAAETFTRASEIDGPHKAAALLGAARNRAATADNAGARAAYERFVAEFPQSPERAFVEAHLAQLRTS